MKLDANEVNKESVVEEEEDEEEVPVIEKTISEEDIKTVSQWTYEKDTALVRWVNDLTDKGYLENGLLSVEDLLCDKENSDDQNENGSNENDKAEKKLPLIETEYQMFSSTSKRELYLRFASLPGMRGCAYANCINRDLSS